MKKISIGLLLFFLHSVAGAQQIIYVNSLARGANNGRNWKNAYTDLSAALKKAKDVDVYIAEGIYVPYLDSNGKKVKNKTATFTINCGVRLKGGFHVNGAKKVPRDPSIYHTILSGDVLGNDVGTVANPNFNDSNRQENISQLLYLKTYCPGYRTNLFDGIEFASANNPSGMSITDTRLDYPDSLSFNNCRFYLNSGDALFMVMANPSLNPTPFFSIFQSTLVQNHLNTVARLLNLNLWALTSRFENTFQGRCFELYASSVNYYYYRNCEILSSTFINSPGTMLKFYAASTQVYVHVANSKFFNVARLLDYDMEGSCIPLLGTLYCYGAHNTTMIQNCLISNRDDLTVCKSYTTNGGSVVITVDHSTLNTSMGSHNALITTELSNPNGIPESAPNAYCAIKNSIVWGNWNNIFEHTNRGSPVSYSESVSYSDIQSGFAGAGNINANPIFIQPLGADNTAATEDDDFHLENYYFIPNSPCIDSGDPNFASTYYYSSTDLDGNPRVLFGTDMGCYETSRNYFQSPQTKKTSELHQANPNLPSISVFPNPASSFVMINGLNVDETYSIEIRDAAGKLISQQTQRKSPNQKIDVSSLANGLYLVDVNSKNGQQFFKIVVKH